MACKVAVGLPDVIGFLCFMVLGLSVSVIPTLQFIALAVKRFGKDSLELSLDCFRTNETERNKTCEDMLYELQGDISSLQFPINIVKGIVSPIFVFGLGAIADVFGQKIPLNFVAVVLTVWSGGILYGGWFFDQCPPWVYIMFLGAVIGFSGGSPFVTINFLTGYLSFSTPLHQRTVRFGTLIGISTMGVVVGPLISGLFLTAYPTKYYICPLISLCISVVNLILTCLLSPIKPEERPKTVISALQIQFATIRDLFKYQIYKKHLEKFVAAIGMYMLCSVGLLAPLVFIPVVYSLGYPFNWTASFLAFFQTGLGVAIGLQNIVTTRLFELCKIDRLNMIRIVAFLGFASTFVLAFAKDNYVLITGVVLMTFICVSHPALQSVILSLVQPKEIGTTIGLMAATQAIAEAVFLNIVIVAYKETHLFMNGFCYFIVTFFLGGALIIALCYRHPKGFDNLPPGSSPTPDSPVGSNGDLVAGVSNEAKNQETAA